MRFPSWIPAVLALMSSTTLIAQSTTPSPPSDALGLLQRVAQHYSDAKSYYIESTEEMSATGDYSRNWQKTVLIAAEADGKRAYFEGHGNMGSAIKVTDGKTAWRYRLGEHRYTAKPATGDGADKPGTGTIAEIASFQAENLRKKLGNLAKSLRSAEFLPEGTLTVNGQPVTCLVVRVQNSDEKRMRGSYPFEKTIWIDKQHEIILKIVEHSHPVWMNAATRMTMDQETTTVYTNTVLDGLVRDSLFTFVPPADAREIQQFPDPGEGMNGGGMTGDPIPALKFKGADGKVVSIESYRGKPVLLDFWATWCGPCVAGLPQLAKVYEEAKNKGLELISIDQDEEAATAANFFAKKGYTWPEFHDGDGEIEKLMGSTGIPRLVLVDAEGQVAYDGDGDESKLRVHLAKLGPEYQELAPKPAAPPCASSR
jgi:thiol-disulfide isomerase/thioredoxin